MILGISKFPKIGIVKHIPRGIVKIKISIKDPGNERFRTRHDSTKIFSFQLLLSKKLYFVHDSEKS
tara:strand:+ start:151 stop:348 length:198 start_codon:yes stop_codon:yes gene_type:complete